MGYVLPIVTIAFWRSTKFLGRLTGRSGVDVQENGCDTEPARMHPKHQGALWVEAPTGSRGENEITEVDLSIP